MTTIFPTKPATFRNKDLHTEHRPFTLALAITAATACGEEPSEPGAEANLVVEERLQQVLDDAVANPAVVLPGSLLHYRNPAYTLWSGAAGLGDIEAEVALRPQDRIRAGSITKPFLSVVALQHVEEGTLSLDQTLPELVPERFLGGIADADRITLRMLLNHTTGLPDWLTEEVSLRVLDDPDYVWATEELLDIAAELPPLFTPGTAWSYSNTNYTLVGLVLEQAAGQSWRQQVRERVIEPLGLDDTSLPEPEDHSIAGGYAHGYQPFETDLVDLTFVDSSMAGAAGGHALLTTTQDLGRFLAAVLAGEMFSDEASLDEMTAFIDAPEDSSDLPHLYGLGLESYVLPDGSEVIGHGGGAGGYSTMMFYAPAYDTTIVASSNSSDYAGNALEVFLPAVEALATDRR